MNICLTILSLASLIFPFLPAANLRREIGFRRASEGNAQTEKPPMFVLQIGISNYKYEKRLSGAADVLKMRELLTGEAYKIPAGNIRMLCDDGKSKDFDGAPIICDGEATKENIIREFETHLIAKAREYNEKTGARAVVLFQFSGHGSQASDANGDETDDAKDETFVTWNSRDAPGENTDISDDEIYALTSKLSLYTDNIVYILDSCNSGTGTRGSDDARSVPARKNAVVPVKAAQNSRGNEPAAKKIEKDEGQTDVLPPSKNYIVISAAQAGHLALQKNVFDCETCVGAKKTGTFGILTYYLMQELRNATETTSYRDVMENVRRKVSAEKPSQMPQIEGDDNRFVFRGLSRVKAAGIKISDVKDKRITLEAGAMQGLGVGTILNIYSIKDEKIAVAKVSEAAADRAFAEIIEKKSVAGVVVSPTRAVSAKDKDRAVLISPDLGAARIKFLPDGDDAAKLTGEDRRIMETLREKFKGENGAPDARGIDLATGKWNDANARWDVALLKDRFDKVFADRSRAAPTAKSQPDEAGEYEKFPAADKQVFYLAGKDFVPLYGFYVEAGNQNAAALVEEAVVHISRLRSVRAIANSNSRLKNSIVIKPFSFTLENDDAPCDEKTGNLKIVGKKPVIFNDASKTYKFKLGVKFGLEIVNTSDVPLYITVFDIGSDGSVRILSPQKIGEEKETGVRLTAKIGKIVLPVKCADSVLETFAPSGIETFKVIASTTPKKRADFEFLEMEALNSRDVGGDASLTSLADWTTAEVNFEISSTPEETTLFLQKYNLGENK